MTQGEFQTQVNRLIETFGKGAYGTERCALIWREVGELPRESWARIVDSLIAECRHAPLMPEIREKLSLERERIWQQEKAENRQAAQDFWEGTYADDEIKHICAYVRRRIEGSVDDPHWDGFMRHLKTERGEK